MKKYLHMIFKKYINNNIRRLFGIAAPDFT